MRDPQNKTIGGKTYTVTPLPAMRALRLMPLVAKGIGNMTPDELERFARELLSMARVDGREMLKTFDIDMQGEMPALMELLAFATSVNYDPSNAAELASGPAAGSPSNG